MTKIHDIAATDKRNPRVAPNSPIYGTDIARDHLQVLDPVTGTREMLIPTLEDRKGMTPSYNQTGYISRLRTLDRLTDQYPQPDEVSTNCGTSWSARRRPRQAIAISTKMK